MNRRPERLEKRPTPKQVWICLKDNSAVVFSGQENDSALIKIREYMLYTLEKAIGPLTLWCCLGMETG